MKDISIEALAFAYPGSAVNALDGVTLTLTEDALGDIADKALGRGTGARGLRAIMEELLVPVMYDVPDREDVSEVVVTDAVVRGEAEPRLVLVDEKKEEKTA